MKKTKKRLAVLFGGKGVEHGISVLSGEFALKHLDPEIFNIFPILIDLNGDWHLRLGKKLRSVSPAKKDGEGGILIGRRFVKIDAAFPVLHGDFGEDGRIQGLLESLDIPFVGCDTVTGAVCSDKGYTKAIAKSLGIPTLPWLSSNGKADGDFCTLCERELGFPIFIKPARLGSSFGAGLANNKEELRSSVRLASELGGGNVIAEKYLNNPRELECAFLALDGAKYITPPGEIRLSRGFYGYSEKYLDDSAASVSICADISLPTAEKICSHARKITDALCVKGLSRVDFFLFDGELYFNEINTMPGMTESSLYPKLIEEIGIAPRELINGLAKDAVRCGR